MMTLSRVRAAWMWAALAAGVFISALPAGAAEKEISLRGSGGPFSHSVREDAWSERSLTVMNSTALPRTIRAGFVCDDPAQGQMFYSRQAEIPPGAIRRLDIAMRPAGVQTPGRKLTKTTITQMAVVLFDGQTGAEVLRDYRTALVLGRNSTVLATVVGGTDEHDDNSYMEALVDRELGHVRFTSTGPVAMPGAWLGYEQADVVLLTGAAEAEASPAQIQALLDWVTRGGVLVVSGSQGLRHVLAGELGRACGVAAIGLHETAQLDVIEMPAAVSAVGQFAAPKPTPLGKVGLDWPVTFTELMVIDAEVLYEVDSLPLLTRRRLGQGHVFCLAAPLSALRPKPLQNIWRHLATARQTRQAVHPAGFAAPGRQTLEQIAGRRGPTRVTAFTLLLMPAGLAAGLGVALLRRRRGEWMWIVLLPFGLAMAGAMVLYGHSRQEQPRLSVVGLVSAAGPGQVRVQEASAFYSGPEAQDVSFRADGPRGVIRDVSLTVSALTSAEVASGAAMSVRMTVPANTTRAVLSESIQPAEGIEGELTFGPTGLTGTLTNKMGKPLGGAVLLANERTYRVGDLPAGQAAAVRVGEDQLLARLTYEDPPGIPGAVNAKPAARPATRPRVVETQAATAPDDDGEPPAPTTRDRRVSGDFTGSTMVRSSDDALRNRLIGSLIAAPSVSRPVSRTPTLVAYMPGSLGDVLDGQNVERQGWSALLWPVRVVPPAPGTKVLVPSGFVEIEYPGSLVWDMMNRRFNPSFANVDMLLVIRPSLAKLELRETTVRLRLAMQALGYRLELGGIVPSGTHETEDESGPPVPARLGTRTVLRTVDNMAGPAELIVPQADRFRDSRGRTLLSLKITRLDAQAALEDMLRWQIDQVDATLEGIAGDH